MTPGDSRRGSFAFERGRGQANVPPSADTYRPRRDNLPPPLAPRQHQAPPGAPAGPAHFRRRDEDDAERERRLEKELAARKQRIRTLQLKKEVCEAEQRERELLAELAVYEKYRAKAQETQAAQAGASRPRQDDSPRESVITTAENTATHPQQPQVVPERKSVDPKQANIPEMHATEDRDVPGQYNQPRLHLDYDGFNNEAVRYGTGYNCGPAAQGMTKKPSEVEDGPVAANRKVSINKAGLMRKIEQQRTIAAIRSHAATPVGTTPAMRTSVVQGIAESTAGSPASVMSPKKVYRPVLPAGVIPGITPNWQDYLQVVEDNPSS